MIKEISGQTWTVSDQMYLQVLQTSIFPTIREMFGYEVFCLQQDGTPPHCHQDVRAYLDDTVPGR